MERVRPAGISNRRSERRDPQRGQDLGRGSGRHRDHRDDPRHLRRYRAGAPQGEVDRGLPPARLPDPGDARDRRRDRAPDLVRPDRRSVRAGPDDPRDQLRDAPPVGRALVVRHRRRHADRPRAPRRAGGIARGGRRRSLRAAGAPVPGDHAPVDAARGARRCAARIQFQPGRHHHLLVRERGRRVTVAGGRLQLASLGLASRDRVRVDVAPVADVVRDRVRGAGPSSRRSIQRRGREDDDGAAPSPAASAAACPARATASRATSIGALAPERTGASRRRSARRPRRPM